MYLYCLYKSHILHIVRNKILGNLSGQNSLQVDFTLCKKKKMVPAHYTTFYLTQQKHI